MCLAEVGKNEGEKRHAYIEAENRTVVAGGWGEEQGEVGERIQMFTYKMNKIINAVLHN